MQDSKNPETEGNVWSFRFWIQFLTSSCSLDETWRGIWEMKTGVVWSLEPVHNGATEYSGCQKRP